MIPKILCLLAAMCLTAAAQTNVTTNITAQNRPLVIVTNRVMAAPNIRVVNGKAYNTTNSQVWKDINFEIEQVLGAEKICLATKLQQRGRDVWSSAWLPDKPIALTNYVATNAAAGNNIRLRAMRTGIYNAGVKPIELWDAGQPLLYQTITTNRVMAKAK